MHQKNHILVFFYIVAVISFLLTSLHFSYLASSRKSTIEIARTYMMSLQTVHKYYSDEIIHRAEMAGLEFEPDYKKFDDKLPFPGTVAMDLGGVLSKANPNLDFNLYSEYPFAWRNGRVLDSFEKQSLDVFSQSTIDELYEISREGDETVVRYSVPVKMTQSCVECHNRPQFGFDREWQIGDLRGARQVSVPITLSRALPDSFILIAIGGTLFLAAIGMGIVWPGSQRLAHALEEKKQDMETLKTTEEKLRQSQKLEAVGRLTAGVAHEFNNIMAVVQGNAELSKLDPQNNDRYMDEVHQAVGRGSNLTQRLLAFSRKQVLRPSTLQVADIASEIVEVFKQTLGPDADVTLCLAQNTWPVIADRYQLEAALLNLMVNARDAVDNSDSLKFSCFNFVQGENEPLVSEDFPAGDYVGLKVSDTGAGMTADTLQRATEPFFTTKALNEGSGLGLPMVHGFAKQSGGHLLIESTPGSGTEATIFLPRAHSDNS